MEFGNEWNNVPKRRNDTWLRGECERKAIAPQEVDGHTLYLSGEQDDSG